MPTGNVVHLVSRRMGGVLVSQAQTGFGVFHLDSADDFNDLGGLCTVDGEFYVYASIDSNFDDMALESAIPAGPGGADIIIPQGSFVDVFPTSVEKWAMVMMDGSGETTSDSVWCRVPHSLKAMLGPDGWRAPSYREAVKFEKQGETAVITDVYGRTPTLVEEAIPQGLIKETHISPGAITTPLLAANAVSAINMQADSISGRELTGDAINGMTITGALIRTSDTGARVEIRSDGILQYDSVNALLTKIGPSGNKFTGSVEATDIIVRDSMQMFGQNNKMGVGSILTLTSNIAQPLQPPSVSWDYEAARADMVAPTAVASSARNVAGAHMSTVLGSYAGVAYPTTGQSSRMWNGTAFTGWSDYKAYTYVRIGKSDGTAERAVTIGETYPVPSGGDGYPDLTMKVWDDSGMNALGTTAPTQLASFVVGHPGVNNAIMRYRLIRCIGPSAPATWRHRWAVLYMSTNGAAPGPQLKVSVYQWNDPSTLSIFGSTSTLSVPGGFLSGEALVGGVYFTGTGEDVGLEGLTAGHTYVVVQTNLRNMLWDVTANTLNMSLWPVMTYAQDVTMVTGDPVSSTYGAFYSWNLNTDTSQQLRKYENNYKAVSENWWASYDWRGDNTTTFRSLDSPKTSITYRSRARLRVTVPALPAPIAGVGAARSPATDVYGWSYYLGRGVTLPPQSQMFRQPIQPVLVNGVPYASSEIILTTYPSWSGSNPNVATSFPVSAPAKITTDAGRVLISGDGDADFRNIDADTLTGPLFDAVFPASEIIYTAGPSTPYRCLPADGALKLRADYPRLFTEIGTIYNTGGETSLQFRLPKVADRVIVGKGTDPSFNGIGSGFAGGEKTHLLTGLESGVQQHNHGVTDPGHIHGLNGHSWAWGIGGLTNSVYSTGVANAGNPPGNNLVTSQGFFDKTSSNVTGITTQVAGHTDAFLAHNNLQPYIVQNAWIRY